MIFCRCSGGWWAVTHQHAVRPARTPRTRAPAHSRRGPGLRVRNTIYRQVRRVVVSAPTADDGFGCEDRISVTGDHLSFDGNCGVHPSTEMTGWWRAIQRCSALPFLCFQLSLLSCCPPVSKPHATSWPRTRATDVFPSGAPNQHRPRLMCPDLDLRRGLAVRLALA